MCIFGLLTHIQVNAYIAGALGASLSVVVTFSDFTSMTEAANLITRYSQAEELRTASDDKT